MKYTIYDNRLVNSVKRTTYKQKGSNILYVKIANFMIKLSYLKKCDFFQKGGGDGMTPKYTREQMDEMKRKYIIDNNMTLLKLKKHLLKFINHDLKEIFVHSRKIKENENKVQILDDFLFEKHPITRNYGDDGEEEIRELFNIKVLLSCLFYIYENYNPYDKIYIENIKYIHKLVVLLDEKSITGVFHYAEDTKLFKKAYTISQRNIFAFIVTIVNLFKRKDDNIDIMDYFNIIYSDNLLEITDNVTISNSSIKEMIDFILNIISNKKRKIDEIDNSGSNSTKSRKSIIRKNIRIKRQ